MINAELQDKLSLLMIRASLKGKYSMMAMAEKHGITLTQALTLCLLEPSRPVPMSYLSTFLTCDPSNVTGIVERLVVCSLIERKEGLKDRRIKMITLTKKGAALRQNLLKIVAEKRLPTLGSLSDDEVKYLIALLDKATGLSQTDIAA